MNFSEKLKQIRKNEGKPLLGYYDKFVGYISQNIKTSLDFA